MRTMRNRMTNRTAKFEARPGGRPVREAGFTLVELMVAMAVVMIISAAGFSLLAQSQPIFNQQQNLAEVNIALRNAIAQIQLDVANAGANYYSSVNIPNYPVGVVVTNNVVASGGDCRTGTPAVYSTNCFDQMSIITADKNTPPTNPTTSALACIDTSAATSGGNGTAYLAPSGSANGYGSGTAGQTAATAAAANYQYSTSFKDQILFVKNDGSQYTTAKLAAAPTTATIGGNYYVLLTYGVTSSTTPGLNTTTNDPYNMTTHSNSMLGNVYCAADYLLRIVPITYKVDLTDPNNPSLLRQIAGQSQTATQQTLATQIIGFKIGVSLFNNVTDTDTTTYAFDASSYDNGSSVPYNYTLLRSVMVSLIGRTTPNPGPSYVFRNTFDNGPYEIQGVSLVVNPRNMSMSD
jgi:prepilin-type N-terminal cleavage/methylation domain-containing protein